MNATQAGAAPSIEEVASIETEAARFALDPATGGWTLTDRRADVTWGNGAAPGPWVALLRAAEGDADAPQRVPLTLRAVETVRDPVAGPGLRARFADPQGDDAGLALVFRLHEAALHVHLLPDAGCPRVVLFTEGLEAGGDARGELLLPIRMGLLLRADRGEPFEQRLGTYAYEEGVHMAMVAMFREGAALMATWGDPHLALHVAREGERAPKLRLAFELGGSARSLALHCLGPGDLSAVAAAYRERAEALGYRVPWEQKLRARPQAAGFFGACNVKLWHALARRIDEDLQETSVEVRWTFDEAAQIAEHLKLELELENVLFHLGGWTRYGYDCRHPDIMPANPECGGNEGLADCARRVRACGYLFCLHDNVQDMYRDAPSWDEVWLQKEPDGTPHRGGVWMGGQAYYTCARQALTLAQRPQNLPRVQEVVAPDVYFIDTTYAVGPQACYDPRHPLTLQEDIRWKQALSDYARDLFGLFGSECGREWAVPHADFFEGLASVRGDYYHFLDPDALGGNVVPFFDMVFGDCIAIYGKYGYDPAKMAEQVIHHVAMGRTLYYHGLGTHRYWEAPLTRTELPFPDGPYDPALFTRAHDGWAEGFCIWDRFMKNTHEVLGPLNARVSRTRIARYEFLDPARLIRRTTFGNGVTTVVNGSPEAYALRSKRWGEMALPPYGFWVEAEDFVAFCALRWNGRAYAAPVLFTLTALDGEPLAASQRVRVFHGFGESTLTFRGRTLDVAREEVVRRRDAP
jgi:hypothetical protein